MSNTSIFQKDNQIEFKLTSLLHSYAPHWNFPSSAHVCVRALVCVCFGRFCLVLSFQNPTYV